MFPERVFEVELTLSIKYKATLALDFSKDEDDAERAVIKCAEEVYGKDIEVIDSNVNEVG